MRYLVHGRKCGGTRSARMVPSIFYIRDKQETFCGTCNRMSEIRKTSIRCRRHANALHKTIGELR